MLKYIVRRLLLLIPILLGLSVFMIVFIHALPGDPCASILGEHTNAERLAACRHGLGLDKPLFDQYIDYMTRLVHGDLGTSATNRISVTTSFLTRFPATIELTIAAMFVSIGLGIPLGIAAAKRQGSLFDNLATVMSLLGISIPIFFLGLLLAYVFGVWLHWLPVIGRYDLRTYNFTGAGTNFLLWESLVIDRDIPKFIDVVKHLILPALALGTIPLAYVARITRSAVIEVLSEDYVRTARAKGLSSERIDSRHVLRNAMLPIATVVGLQTGLLLGGAVLTETIFSWGGVGTWLYQAAVDKDFLVIQSGTLILATIFVLVNLAVDVSYAFLNPRIRYS
ncbi:MAG: ABC transporter permease [Chloroflexi bacterium]|nr:ABC transporter permease [Chloroflexota bacterium]